MPQQAIITISYDLNNDWYVISDSLNEFSDFQATESREVEKRVRKWRRHFELAGCEVVVNWPRPWPPEADDLEGVFSKG